MFIKCKCCGEQVKIELGLSTTLNNIISGIKNKIKKIGECKHKNLHIPYYLRIQKHAKCRLFCTDCMKVIDWSK